MRLPTVMFAAACLVWPQTTPPGSDEKSAGDQAAAAAHFDEAARHYETFVRQNPSEENLFFLGSFLLNHNGFEPARKLFQFAAGKYAESTRLAVGLGIAQYSLGQYDDAVQTLCAASDADPNDNRALQFLAKMYDVSPAYANEVTKRLERFARVHPNNAAANYYYALSLLNGSPVQDASQGERFLRRAIQLDAYLTDAHFELGVLLDKTSRVADAIGELKIATDQQPELVKAHYRLARLYSRNGQEELAQAEYALIQRLKERSDSQQRR